MVDLTQIVGPICSLVAIIMMYLGFIYPSRGKKTDYSFSLIILLIA
ncbi:MAG: hypothetical protein ACTSUE_25305 [Promethearchaeota archaeon]